MLTFDLLSCCHSSVVTDFIHYSLYLLVIVLLFLSCWSSFTLFFVLLYSLHNENNIAAFVPAMSKVSFVPLLDIPPPSGLWNGESVAAAFISPADHGTVLGRYTNCRIPSDVNYRSLVFCFSFHSFLLLARFLIHGRRNITRSSYTEIDWIQWKQYESWNSNNILFAYYLHISFLFFIRILFAYFTSLFAAFILLLSYE